MAFSDDTLSKSAFKTLQGKAHTGNAKDLPNETEPTTVTLSAQEIFRQTIPTDPDDAHVTDVAKFVQLDLELDASSNGKAYDVKVTTVASTALNGFTNPRTGIAYADGDRVGYFVPPKFDAPTDPPPVNSYRAILKDNGSEVAPSDATNWYFDYRAGIVVSETNLSLGSTGTIDGYVYVGDFLDDVASDGYNTWIEDIASGNISNLNSGDVLPAADLTHNFGNTSFRWKDGYFESIYMGDNITQSTHGFINITTTLGNRTGLSMLLDNATADNLTYPTIDWYGNDTSFGSTLTKKGEISLTAAADGIESFLTLSVDDGGPTLVPSTYVTYAGVRIWQKDPPGGFSVGMPFYAKSNFGAIPGLFEQETPNSDSVHTILSLLADSEQASILNGFGAAISFEIRDTGIVTTNEVGQISVERENSADDTAAMKFSTANAGTLSPRLTISSEGFVGVGDETPDYDLVVSEASGADLALNRADASIVDGDAVGTIRFRGDDATADGARIWAEATSSWGGGNFAAAVLKFSSQDNGAGDSAAAPKFIVSSTGAVVSYNRAIEFPDSSAFNTPTFHVHKSTAGAVTADSNSTLIVENNTANFISILHTDSSEAGLFFGTPTHENRAGIIYDSTDQSIELRNNTNIPKVRLDSVGDWFVLLRDEREGGIKIVDNEDAANQYAHILYDSGGANTLHFYVDSGTALMSLDDSQRVGIGDTTPAAKLEVNNGSSTDEILQLSDNGSARFIFPDGISAADYGYQLFSTDGSGTVEWAEPLAPSRQVLVYDDFMFYQTNSKWDETTGTTGDVAILTSPGPNVNGIINIRTGTNAAGYCSVHNNSGSLEVGGGSIVFEAYVNIPTLSDATNEFEFRIGIGDDNIGAGRHVDGVYFEYDRTNSTSWRGVTANGGSSSETSTSSVVSSATWYKLRLEVASGGTSVQWWVNDVSIGIISGGGNIPTTNNTGLSMKINKTNGTATRQAYIDYFYFHKFYNTAK